MLCAILTLLCIGGASGTPGASDVSVVLPASATAIGMEISVEEIATVTGDDQALVARVRAASLGYAPAPGYHRVLRADLIEASLARTLPGVTIVVTGAPRCRITCTTELITAERIRAEATKAMRSALIGSDAKATFEGELRGIEVPKGAQLARIVVPGDLGQIHPGLRTVLVQIWVGDNLYRTVHATFRISMWRRCAVLARGVNAGERLTIGMFVDKRVPIGDSRGLQALNGSQLGGAVALRAMAAGSIVIERDVHREVIVRRGDHVGVRITKGTIVVTDVGIAAADGVMGERVLVTLLSTGRELSATVRGARIVEVHIQ